VSDVLVLAVAAALYPALVMFALVEIPGWLRTNSRELAAVIAGGIGAYLVIRGLVPAL
jgi:hypothetical protein